MNYSERKVLNRSARASVSICCVMLALVSLLSVIYSYIFYAVLPYVKTFLTGIITVFTDSSVIYARSLCENLFSSMLFQSFNEIVADMLCFFIPFILFAKYILKISSDRAAPLQGGFVKGIIPTFAFANIASSGASQFCESIGSFVFPGLFSGNAVGGYVSQTSATTGVLDLLIYFLLLCVVAPVFEELVFRGIIFASIRPYGKGFAVVVSSLLFGLLHGNISQFVYAVTFGLVLATVREKTGNLKSVILLHFMNNAFSFIMADIIPFFADNKLSVLINSVAYFALAVLSFFGIKNLFSGKQETGQAEEEAVVEAKVSSVVFSPGFLLLAGIYVYRLFTIII